MLTKLLIIRINIKTLNPRQSKGKNIMKKIIILTSFLFLIHSFFVFSQSFNWLKTPISSGANDGIVAFDVDNAGNTYVIGNYGDVFSSTNTQTLILQNSPLRSITTTNQLQDIFVAKYDAIGAIVWLKSLGSTNNDYPIDIVVRPDGIELYIVGMSNGSLTLQQASPFSAVTLPSGNIYTFIHKMNPDDGNGLVAQQIKGNASVQPKSMAYNNGKLVISGYTSGNGVTSQFPSTPIPFQGNYSGGFDIFIASFDTSLNLLRSKIFGGIGSDIGWALDIDADENVYVGGSFGGTADFGGGITKTATGANGDSFVAKYAPSSTNTFNYDPVWVKHFASNSVGGRTTAIKSTTTKLYATGFMNGTTDFDDGANVNSVASAGGDDLFVVTINNDATGTIDKVKGSGTNGTDEGTGIDVDTEGNIYISGYVGLSSSSPLDIGAGYDKFFPMLGGYDGFVGILNEKGEWACATTMGGVGSDFCMGIKKTATKIIYGGRFSGTVNNFNPESTSTSATATGDDLFLVSLNVTPFTVYNKNDIGFGSLRQSILNTNASANATTINFKIPGTGTQSINVLNPNLPTITQRTTIDGYSQNGSSLGNPTIKIDGVSIIGGGIGLTCDAQNSLFKGLNISRFSNTGIQITNTATNNTISGCLIGTDITGTSTQANGIGILVNANTTMIDANLISGNTLDGVRVVGANNCSIINNTIGLNKAKTAALANGINVSTTDFGIFVSGSSGTLINTNTIGGHSNSGDGGIRIVSSNGSSAPNIITNNQIGVSGTTIFSNTTGILIDGSTYTNIGSATAGNTISGNLTGIKITRSATPLSTNNKIVGNKIGTDANSAVLGNTNVGILVELAGNNDNSIGGTNPGEGNNIANNGRGVEINTASQNSIANNSFYCNNIPIALNNAGNLLKAAPVITNAGNSVQGTSVVGDKVQVYIMDNTTCVMNTTTQGKTYLGTATTLSGGTWNLPLANRLSNGVIVTALATDISGNTSQFSLPYVVVSSPNLFTANTISISSIRLDWTLVSGSILGYQIERCDNNTFTGTTLITLNVNTIPAATITFNDLNLQNNKEYFYRIRTVVNMTTFSAWSAIVSAVTGAVSSAPTNLIVVSVPNSFKSTRLTWSDNSNNELGFEIERASIFTNNIFERIKIVDENITQYTDNEQVLANVRYVYRVRAINIIINSPYSNQYPITLAIDPTETAPTLPVNLVATSVSSEQIDLFWIYNVNPAVYFVIERRLGLSGTFAVLDTIVNSSQTNKFYADIKNLTANQQYCYKIRAFGIGGVSPYSQTQCVSAVCGLTDLVVTRDDISSNPPICSGKSAALRLNKRPYKALYQWKKNNVNIIGAVFPIYLAEETGLYSCTVTISGTTCTGTTLAPITIIVQGTPTPASITYSNSCLRSSVLDANPNSYQWYKNYVPIIGANQNQYCTNNSGIYYVTFMINNCASTSSVYVLGDANALENDLSKQLKVYPNPTQDELNLELETNLQGKYQWIIKDMNGKTLIELQGEKNEMVIQQKINLQHLPNGMYILEWKNERGQARKKIIKR